MEVTSDLHTLAVLSPGKISHHPLSGRLDWCEREGDRVGMNVVAFNYEKQIESGYI
jgi:hypothetical protein